MGFFSDKCMALIDPATKRALTGQKLEQARSEKNAPRCENRVKKAARFCNVCGHPAPGGWWRCPSCRKWVGNDSNFCSHCNQPLFPEDRAEMAGGVWKKSGDLFARRFEIGDIERLLKKDLQVQAGTVALLMDGGKFKGILEAGQHDPDSLARRINHFGNPPPRSVVLVDAGDVILPLGLDGLKTSEGFEVDFSGEVVVRFRADNKGALAFLENRFKEKAELSYAQLAEPLAREVQHAVSTVCTSSTIEDLVRDPERRLRLQDEMQRTLEAGLARAGLDLVYVSSAEFEGEQFDEFLEQNAELEKTRRETEYIQRMRELTSRESMDKFRSELELKEYQELLAHEHEISGARRDRELQQLLRGWKKQDELDELRHDLQVGQEALAGKIGLKVAWEGYEREKAVKDAETGVRVRDIAFEQDKKEQEWKDAREREETEWAMGLRREKDEHASRMRAEQAERRSRMSNMERLMDADDEGTRRALLEAMRLEAQKGSTPEQILAQAAADSPAAAEALARMKESAEDKYRELLTEMQTLYKDTADRQDKNLATMLEPAKEAAKRQDSGGNQTIVR